MVRKGIVMVDYSEYTRWIRETYHFLNAGYELRIGEFYLTLELSPEQISRFGSKSPFLKKYKVQAEMLAAQKNGCPLGLINPIDFVGKGNLLYLPGFPDAIAAFLFLIFSDEFSDE